MEAPGTRVAPAAAPRRTVPSGPPGEPGAAPRACLRRSALDRRRDPGLPGPAHGESADGAAAPARELPPGIPSRLGEQDLLPPAPHRPAVAGQCRPAPRDPPRQ